MSKLTRKQYISKLGAEIGKVVQSTISQAGDDCGFVLGIFDSKGPEITWVSTVDRSEMVTLMQEFIRKTEQP